MAESLDRDFQRASHHAARLCSRRTQAPWSPRLAEAWAELHFYRLACTKLRVDANLSPAFHKLQSQWPHLPKEVPTDQNAISQGHAQALKKLKEARLHAKEFREEHLKKRAELYSAMQDNGKHKALQRLIRAESQHRVYNKIRYLRNQESGTMGLTSLKIPRNISPGNVDAMKQLPDSPDHWETVTVPERIESLLLQRNRHHFGQSEGTPFTMPPLQANIGYKADGYAAELILAGQMDEVAVEPATQLLIEHLQSRTAATLHGTISAKEVCGKLMSWKESTSTSPSGLHLGHYHCMWRKPNDENRDKIVEDQQNLLECLVNLLNYSLKYGYTFRRWTKIVNIMLQKDQGNPRIHRLRVIHIYEADYNLLLAVKWRQALHHAEDNNLLNEGLYGSRPGRSAHDPALIEVLQHEMYRMSMKPGINFDLDATSCYDRILASLASISSRRVGMAKNVAYLNATTLEQASYHLKTSLGISTENYSHCNEYPIHGTGQGSGNSPTIWCFVCSALFDAFESQAQGAIFTNYENTETMQMYMIGFVDDCTQRVNMFNARDQPSAERLIQLMQKDTQLWNDLLWASGGALEQAKCSFHLVQTSWNADGHPFLTGGVQNMCINLLHNGSTTATNQKTNYTSHKTLGCFINPAHCHTQTWSVLQQKNSQLASLLETNYFTRSEAWTFYTAIYLPSITYPLPITPLSRTQCQSLDTRFLRALIPRCGYNRNMSSAVRYAPFMMGGAGFKQLYTEQGALILQQIVKFLNSDQTQIGKLLRMTISWTQAFLGTSTLFLTEVNRPIPPSGPSLLLDLRQFLRHINGYLILQTRLTSTPLRRDDRFIMDIALMQQQWNRRHLSQINACRRYLQAQTLADITTMAGTRIQTGALVGEKPSSMNSDFCSSFNQAKPSEVAWRTWRRFMLTISNKRGVLNTPLGQWVVDHKRLRHWPSHLYDPADDQLYSHVHGSEYRAHHRFTRGTFLLTYHHSISAAKGYPTSVLNVAGVLRPQKNYVPVTLPNTLQYTPNQGTFENLPKWEQELLEHCRILQPLQAIQVHLQKGNITICSDGSATHSNASFGFVVSTIQGQRLVKCSGPAPGAYPNSFRSEAYGVLASMRWLYRMTETMQFLQTFTIDHYLDNESVIKRLKQMQAAKYTVPNRCLKSEQDVIQEIIGTLPRLSMTVKFRWVKGHQDETTPFHLLPLPAQLNCEADKEATSFADENKHSPLIANPLPGTPCQLVIQHKSITSKIKRQVHKATTIPALLTYLATKFNWGPTTTDEIDWELFSNIIQKYKSKWTTIVKHIHDISPTGHIAHRNNTHVPHECPACSIAQENNLHVMICPYPSRAQWRASTIQRVVNHNPGSSDPFLVDILHDGLIRFHRQIELIDPDQYPQRYTQLILTQNAIGWDQLYKGRWSLEWKKSHNAYANSVSDTRKLPNGQSWVLSIGRLLIDQWLVLWKLRNEERHGKDEKTQKQARLQVLTSELKELYSYKTRVSPTDKCIFYNSVEEHLRHHVSLDHIEDWISIHREAIKASVQHATTLGLTRNRTLLDYPAFNPILRQSS